MTLVSHVRLRDFVVEVLGCLSVPLPDATTTADCLVSADLEGHASHGVIRLPFYANRLRQGLVTPQPVMRVIAERAAAATLDAGNGLGPVAGTRAMELAIAKARHTGVGVCAVRASNHLGALSYYVKQAATQGLIGLSVTNTPPAMAPPGGRQPFLGTNPIAAAIPTSSHPIVIDLATSQVARGRILAAARAGEAIPQGWALDAVGRPTTATGPALAGSLVPLGGAKGFSLALLVEILSSLLSGAGIGPEVSGTFAPSDQPSNVGHCMIALDPAAFGGGFLSRADQLCLGIRSAPAVDAATPIRMPGDRALSERTDRELEGINLPEPVIADLRDLAATVGATPVA